MITNPYRFNGVVCGGNCLFFRTLCHSLFNDFVKFALYVHTISNICSDVNSKIKIDGF